MSIYSSAFHLCSPFTIIKSEGQTQTQLTLHPLQKIAALSLSSFFFTAISGSITLLVFFGLIHFPGLGAMVYVLAIPVGSFPATLIFYVMTYIQKKLLISAYSKREALPIQTSIVLKPEQTLPIPEEPTLEPILPILEPEQVITLLKASSANPFSFFEKKFTQIAKQLLIERKISEGKLNPLERQHICCFIALEVIAESSIEHNCTGAHLSIKDDGRDIAKCPDAKKNDDLASALLPDQKPYLYSLWSSPNIPTYPIQIKKKMGNYNILDLKKSLFLGNSEDPLVQGIGTIASQIDKRYLSNLDFFAEGEIVKSACKNLDCPFEWENNPYKDLKNIHDVFSMASLRVAQGLINQFSLQKDEDYDMPSELVTSDVFKLLILLEIFTYAQIDEDNRIFFNSNLCVNHEVFKVDSNDISYFVNDLTLVEGEREPLFLRTLALFKKLSPRALNQIKAQHALKIIDPNSAIEQNALSENLDLLITFLPYFNFANLQLDGILVYPAVDHEEKKEVANNGKEEEDIQVLQPKDVPHIDINALERAKISPSSLRASLNEKKEQANSQAKITQVSLSFTECLAKFEAEFLVIDTKTVTTGYSCFVEAMCNLIFENPSPLKQYLPLGRLISFFIQDNIEKFINSSVIEIHKPNDNYSSGEIEVDDLGAITIYTENTDIETINDLKKKGIRQYCNKFAAAKAFANELTFNAIGMIFDRPIYVYTYSHSTIEYNLLDDKLCPMIIYQENLPGAPFCLALSVSEDADTAHFRALIKK